MSSKKCPKILLVEDNETDVKIVLRAFDKAKFSCDVKTVSNGEEALQYIEKTGAFEGQEKCPPPDVIVLDINMPRMDGHTFVRELKASGRFGEIPVIVFTSKEKLEDLFRIEGIDDYVKKTIDAKDLIAKIKELTTTEA